MVFFFKVQDRKLRDPDIASFMNIQMFLAV